jgi:hypothetical protein
MSSYLWSHVSIKIKFFSFATKIVIVYFQIFSNDCLNLIMTQTKLLHFQVINKVIM